MPGLLDRKTLFVREHVRVFKAANAYDLVDPVGQQVVGLAQEQVDGFVSKLLKFTKWKTHLAFTIHFHDAAAGDAVVLSVHRPFTWFKSVVSVTDGHGKHVGQFVQKLMAIGPSLTILDGAGQEIGALTGNWTGWKLQVRDKAGSTLCSVSKQWAGVGRELLSTADNYVIDLADGVKDPGVRRLLFAAPITADMVYKERA